MLTRREKWLVSPYVTNLDSAVFGFLNLPPEVKGALFGRYSRSELGARELLAREFLSGKNKLRHIVLDNLMVCVADRLRNAGFGKGDAFYSKVLDQFGDDSVAELGHTELAVEGVSNVVVKIIEDRRIGISPLEKSSRYVRFDKKDEFGKYPYFRDPDIWKEGLIPAFEKAMDLLFDTYAELLPLMLSHFENKFPRKEDEGQAAYNNAIKAQACDTIRYLLPMCTKTNVGLVGNGRAFEYLIYNLRSCGFAEADMYADMIMTELNKIMPAFIRRAKSEKGQKHIEYLKKLNGTLFKEAQKFEKEVRAANFTTTNDKALLVENIESGVSLVDYDDNGELNVAAAILYDNLGLSLQRAQELLTKNHHMVGQIIHSAVEAREHRTHKPPRAFEHTDYTFEIVCDIGAFRDLHRHRVLTQQRKPYTVVHGYSVPEDIIVAGAGEKYTRAMDGVRAVYEKLIRVGLHKQAQYVVPFGYLLRFVMRMNAREAYHLCELRTQKGAHVSYKLTAQKMAKEIQNVHPAIGASMMINWADYAELTRIAQETRREKKERERNKK